MNITKNDIMEFDSWYDFENWAILEDGGNEFILDCHPDDDLSDNCDMVCWANRILIEAMTSKFPDKKRRLFTMIKNLILVKMDLLEQVRYTGFAAEHVLPIFESKFADNKLPRIALNAALKCLENQVNGNEKNACEITLLSYSDLCRDVIKPAGVGDWLASTAYWAGMAVQEFVEAVNSFYGIDGARTKAWAFSSVNCAIWAAWKDLGMFNWED